MQIETERLLLVALTAEQLGLWVKNPAALEETLGCHYHVEPVGGHFLEVIKGQAEKASMDEENYLYYTFWFLVRKADCVVVGSACFKNAPNEHGEIEIGYGLGKDFEHNGYMTECVNAMCGWALEQKDVSCVIAETDVDNPASENVLRRCGFQLYKQVEMNWWRI